jgi:chorismate synthase
MRQQQTVDIEGKAVSYEVEGRHDVCAVPRALPVVEAMTAMAIVDVGGERITSKNF